MTLTSIEIALARGAAFRDPANRDADIARAKAQMGARITRILDDAGLTVRQAELRTGVSHVEFSRIRQAKLRRLTLDRLMAILESLGQDVEVSVTVHARPVTEPLTPAE